MNGWIDGWAVVLVLGWMDEWMGRSAVWLMLGWMDEWMGSCVGAWVGG